MDAEEVKKRHEEMEERLANSMSSGIDDLIWTASMSILRDPVSGNMVLAHRAEEGDEVAVIYSVYRPHELISVCQMMLEQIQNQTWEKPGTIELN